MTPPTQQDVGEVLSEAHDLAFQMQNALAKSDDPRCFELRKQLARLIGNLNDYMEDN